MTSRTFDSGQFLVSFQALNHGVPITVTGAGLNQEETMQHSFFDIYFEVDNGGSMVDGALGISALMPTPPPITPTQFVTGAGQTGWSLMPAPPQ